MSLLATLKKKAAASQIPVHPLVAKNIDIRVANAYLGGTVLAALLDDDSISEQEEKRLRDVGISFRMSDEQINEVIATVKGLKSDDDKAGYIEEIISALNDRDIALFFICDLAMTLGSKGQYTDNDIEYFNAIAEWLGIKGKDLEFICSYKDYLFPGKGSNATDTVYNTQQNGVVLPDGLVMRFTPNLKAKQIKGGTLPPGETRICNGRFRLDEPIIVNQGSTLVIAGAEIEFGIKAFIEVQDTQLTISNSKLFAAHKKPPKKLGEDFNPFLLYTSCNLLLLDGCEMDGNMIRKAISHNGNLIMRNCKLSSFISDELYIIQVSKDATITNSEFIDLKGAAMFIMKKGGKKLDISGCKFEQCVVNFPELFECSNNKASSSIYCSSFVKCSSGRRLLTGNISSADKGWNYVEDCNFDFPSVSKREYEAELKKFQNTQTFDVMNANGSKFESPVKKVKPRHKRNLWQ